MMNPYFTIALIFCITFILLAPAYIKKSKLKKSPKLNSRAKLISKSTNTAHNGTLYYLTFELENGSRKTFNVKIEEYGETIENETGILSYKEHGDLIGLISFKRDIK